MQIFLASQNPSKLKEIQAALCGLNLEFLTPSDFGWTEEPVEDGRTFAENAEIKIRFFARKLSEVNQSFLPILADDSGILIEAFPTEFGIQTARMFGPNLSDDEWLQKFLQKMEGAKTRRARFVSVVAFWMNLTMQFFTGEVVGEILRAPAAPIQPKIPLSSVFLPDGSAKVFSAMSVTEKARFSHRGLALNKLRLVIGSV